MLSRNCPCGKSFKTNFSRKMYCSKKCQSKISKDNIWDKVKSDYKWRCRQLLGSSKYRAKQLKVEHNLDKSYLVGLWESQNGCCAVSGRRFDLSRPEQGLCVNSNSPSLDRINPKEGYIKGNVRFVCYQVNTALNQYGEQALIDLCKDILSYNGVVA